MKSRMLTSITVITFVAALAISLVTAAQNSPSPDHKLKHHTYKLIDIGTLGGPFSQVNGGPPPMINNEGVVGGLADTSTPCPYLDPFSDAFVSHAFKWQKGVLIDIGLLPGGCFSLPNAINSSGMIAGAGNIDVIDPLTGLPEMRATIWKGGQIIDPGTFGGANSLANDLNDRGQVTGGAENTDSDPWNFAGLIGLPSPTAWRGFIWHDGVMRDLGTLGGPDSFGIVVNEPGQVAGFSFTNDIPNPTTGIPTVDPFLWENGRIMDLGSLGGTLGFANALNSRGQVVGFSNTAGDLTSHPFIWERGVLTDIGTLGGDNGSANWINDAGQVVGTGDLADGTHHAFVWWKGKITDLGTVGSDPCSNGFHINSSGQMIGTSTNCHGTVLHAFLWENGSIIDLNALVLPGSGFTVIEPVVINERGEIAGNGTLANGDAHALVLTPDGECDDACEARIAASQNNAAAAAQAIHNAEAAIRTNAPLTPLEHFRNLMRPRYPIPGARAVPRN